VAAVTLEQLLESAKRWAHDDVDPATIRELLALVTEKNEAELRDRFSMNLEFGTAGLRGVLGAGPNRMNRAVVLRTTAGLARYLKATTLDAAGRGVVIGRDGRRQSDVFARDVAEVLAAEGITAHVLDGVSPTPLTAYAVTALGAAAGVMVTASHNPPEYNGYKVYWGNGAQIIPPHDAGIAAAIDRVEAARDVQRLPEAQARAKNLWRDVSRSVRDGWLDGVLALRPLKVKGGVRIVYTAMHGVGGASVLEVLSRAGFQHVFPVLEQQEPDGAFPTVRFPNPEEKGALDLATALAQREKADVVLANDPDADRLAVMARDASGGLKLLTGNEVGVLLGHFLLTHAPKSPRPLVETTIVSSAQLRTLAEAFGAAYEETLTGFKWIANQALAREADGSVRFLFGYEEALGYTAGTLVRDKDGVGAAAVVADLAADCARKGLTLFGQLEAIQRAHGLFVATQFNATLPGESGAKTIRAVMDGFRARPPASVGAQPVRATTDYGLGAGGLPKSNVLTYQLDGARITVRPSGTEPKVKVYFEVREPVAQGEPMAAARARAAKALETLERDFLVLARERGLPSP